jgi:hypothetical protein
MSAHRLFFLAVLILFVTIDCYSQDKRPDAALNTVVGSIGITEVKGQMLLREVRSKLDKYYRLISARLFDQAYEKWEEQVQSEEQCTSEKCIRFIQDSLQIERMFSFSIMKADELTQLSITLIRVDDTLSETVNCEDCGQGALLNRINFLIRNIVSKDLGRKTAPFVQNEPEPLPQPVQPLQVPEQTIEPDDGWPWWYWALIGVGVAGIAVAASGSSSDDGSSSSSSPDGGSDSGTGGITATW